MQRAMFALTAIALPLLAAAPARAQAPTAAAPLANQGCVGCHGPGGSGSAALPAIAGRPTAELQTALVAFRANTRPGTIMGRIIRGYTEAEIAALASYFAQLPPGGPR